MLLWASYGSMWGSVRRKDKIQKGHLTPSYTASHYSQKYFNNFCLNIETHLFQKNRQYNFIYIFAYLPWIKLYSCTKMYSWNADEFEMTSFLQYGFEVNFIEKRWCKKKIFFRNYLRILEVRACQTEKFNFHLKIMKILKEDFEFSRTLHYICFVKKNLENLSFLLKVEIKNHLKFCTSQKPQRKSLL